MDKNLLFEEFAKEINKRTKSVYFIDGDATQKIIALMNDSRNESSNKIKGVYNNIEDLLTDVKKEVQNGDVILFSPGATSFNFFQNEWDRGRKFNSAVNKVFSI